MVKVRVKLGLYHTHGVDRGSVERNKNQLDHEISSFKNHTRRSSLDSMLRRILFNDNCLYITRRGSSSGFSALETDVFSLVLEDIIVYLRVVARLGKYKRIEVSMSVAR